MPVLKIHHENENATHFITLTTIEWIDIFTKKISRNAFRKFKILPRETGTADLWICFYDQPYSFNYSG